MINELKEVRDALVDTAVAITKAGQVGLSNDVLNHVVTLDTIIKRLESDELVEEHTRLLSEALEAIGYLDLNKDARRLLENTTDEKERARLLTAIVSREAWVGDLYTRISGYLCKKNGVEFLTDTALLKQAADALVSGKICCEMLMTRLSKSVAKDMHDTEYKNIIETLAAINKALGE